MAIPRDKALTAVREGQELAFEHHSARLPVSSASQALADSLHGLVSSGEHIRDVMQVGTLSRLPAGEDFSGTLAWYVVTDRALVHVEQRVARGTGPEPRGQGQHERREGAAAGVEDLDR